MDASHFVLGCDFLGGIYSKTRRFVRTFSGRQRYNVLGAINFVTKKVHTITNATYITATEICQMLKTVAAEYPSKKIHIVLDNARYQKCELVTSLAKELGIDLVYIPPYSPNLNPIERLWKFTKGKLRVKYYSDFKSFKDAIESTTPVQALKYCERLLRRLSQHLTFSLASLPQKRGMEFPHRCLYLSNNVICPSTPSLRNSFLYSFP